MNYLHCHSDSKSEIVYYPGGKVEITFICIAEAQTRWYTSDFPHEANTKWEKSE
jgi:hypothetical protein